MTKREDLTILISTVNGLELLYDGDTDSYIVYDRGTIVRFPIKKKWANDDKNLLSKLLHEGFLNEPIHFNDIDYHLLHTIINDYEEYDVTMNDDGLITITENDKNIIKEDVLNHCQYCGQPTYSADADVLCSECREVFGHAFYSDL